MDRSRADDILREWSAVTRTARRPLSAPRAHITRTALPAGLLAAATLALVAVFLFGLGSRSNGPDVGASSSASSSASYAPAQSTESASTRPSASGSQAAGTRAATVVATVPNCSPQSGWLHAVSGDDLFVVCYDTSDGHPYVARLNMTTNKVVATYRPDPAKLIFTYIDHVAVDGGQLWMDGSLGSACIAPCPGFRHLARIDLATGETAQDLSDWGYRGDGLGFVWASNQEGQLVKLDPATGAEKGRVAFKSESLQFACGSMWGLTVDNPSSDAPTTTVARIDPADGTVLATFTEPGKIGGLSQVGAECWAPALSNPDPTPGYAVTEVPYFNHFDRIGQSSIEFRSPAMPWSQGCAAIFDGTFWLLGNYYVAWLDPATGNLLATMQRIDPATWKPTGTIWTYTGAEPALGVDGALWAGNDRDNPTALQRLDVPLGSIGS